MNTPKTETDADGVEYSPVDSKGGPIPTGEDALSADEQNELRELEAKKRERNRQNRFQAQQRSRRRSREMTDKGIAQSRRIGY